MNRANVRRLVWLSGVKPKGYTLNVSLSPATASIYALHGTWLGQDLRVAHAVVRALRDRIAAPKPVHSADSRTLDRIAMWLDRTYWSADTLDRIADLVRASGRAVREPEEAKP
jgi:hypothetical protein